MLGGPIVHTRADRILFPPSAQPLSPLFQHTILCAGSVDCWPFQRPSHDLSFTSCVPHHFLGVRGALTRPRPCCGLIWIRPPALPDPHSPFWRSFTYKERLGFTALCWLYPPRLFEPRCHAQNSRAALFSSGCSEHHVLPPDTHSCEGSCFALLAPLYIVPSGSSSLPLCTLVGLPCSS
jgi:hypothetical protein